MPLIYRVMTRDGDKPKVGNSARCLGVRLPPSPHADINVNDDGTVEPGGGGMSVSPNVDRLPRHRVPKRLSQKVADASGFDDDSCWCMGSGAFEEGPISPGLILRMKGKLHGLIEPAFRMPLGDYQSALAATVTQWQIEE